MPRDHDPPGPGSLEAEAERSEIRSEAGRDGPKIDEESLAGLPADSFGRLLRFWRKAFEESQESLALALESSPRHISRLENGRVRPSRAMVVRIARHFGLGEDETRQLLYAGGFAVAPDERDFGDPEAKWLRRAAARTLEAFDPNPAVIFDEAGDIRMINRGAHAILKPTERELSVADAIDFLFEAVDPEAAPKRWLEYRCGVVMILQHEAVLSDNPRLQALVRRLVERHRLPSNWQRLAVGVDTMSSLVLPMTLQDRTVRVTIFTLAIGLHHPTPYPVGPRLTLIAFLVEKDPETLAWLERDREADHPLLFSRFA